MDALECCGVTDALERHDPFCPRAIDLGLPRLAEGEEPIDVEQADAPLDIDAPDEVKAPTAGPVALTKGSPCVGCGRSHCTPRDRKLGALRIAAECEWRLKYPDMEAHEVIADLEEKLRVHAAE